MILYVLILAVAFGWIMGLFDSGNGDLSYSAMVELFEQEKVQRFTAYSDQLVLILREPVDGKTTLVVSIADQDSFRREMWDIIQAQ